MVEDRQLVSQYASQRSDDAFAELVRRHLDMVYATALRLVNGDRHLAEDVAQNVFADLARKSKDLTGVNSVCGWLYTSARFAASNAVRTEVRRRDREQTAHELMNATNASPATPDGLKYLIDEALDQLSDQDREAVLLRYFESKEFSLVGASLGVTENAARMRVDRSLDKLRAILEKRGINTTGVALSAAFSGWAAEKAPVALATVIRKMVAIQAASSNAATVQRDRKSVV